MEWVRLTPTMLSTLCGAEHHHTPEKVCINKSRQSPRVNTIPAGGGIFLFRVSFLEKLTVPVYDQSFNE
jgi:hypothetical protein